MVEVIEKLADVLAYGNFQLHAKVVSKLLSQLVVEADIIIIKGAIGQRREHGTDAQLPPLFDRGDSVFWFAKPGNRWPQGRCQQQRHNADEQVINL